MYRSPVQVRDAVLEDADDLREVWSAPMDPDGGCSEEARASSAAIMADIAADPDQRILVAQLDDRVVGAVQVWRSTVSPVHPESTVRVSHLQVMEGFRRHGVGRALLEAVVTWAEEKDTDYVMAAASANSRDANRFMARLGLGQVAVVRAAPVSTLRAKLPADIPAAARTRSRSARAVGQVLAQRRSLRRARTRSV
ncbi:MAG: GNAT family N-acetyltransferase [Nocardioidaceae bacterium]